MKRVCLLVNNEFRYDFRTKLQANALVKAGYHVTILAVESAFDSVPKEEIAHNLIIHRLLKKRFSEFRPSKLRSLWTFIYIATHYRRFEFVHVFSPALLSTARLLSGYQRAKLIYDCDRDWDTEFEQQALDLTQELEHYNPGALKRKLKRLQASQRTETALLSQCHALIVPDTHYADKLAQKVRSPLPPTIAMKNIPLKAGEVTPPTTAVLAEQYHLEAQHPIVFYTGPIADTMHNETLVDAVNTMPDTHLILAGKANGRYLQKLFAKICKTPALRETMFIQPLPPGDAPTRDWLLAATVVVTTVRGIGHTKTYGVPSEVLGCITDANPIDVLRSTAFYRIIIENGFGFELTPDDPQAMGEELKQALSNKDSLLEKFQVFLAKLNWEEEMIQLATLYKQLESGQTKQPLSAALL